MRTLAVVGILLLLTALLLPAAAAACPDCKDAASDAETPGGSANLGRGFYWSILLMLAAPFSIIGTVGFLILRSRRRQARQVLPGSVTARLFPHSRGARL